MRQLDSSVIVRIDSQGQRTLLCPVPVEAAHIPLWRMRRRTGSRFALLRRRQRRRDGDAGFHITLAAPAELASLDAATIAAQQGRPHAFRLIGLGRCERGRGEESWHVVVESDAAQAARAAMGLGSKDLHVTLGFDPEDIHDRAKDRRSLVEGAAPLRRIRQR